MAESHNQASVPDAMSLAEEATPQYYQEKYLWWNARFRGSQFRVLTLCRSRNIALLEYRQCKQRDEEVENRVIRGDAVNWDEYHENLARMEELLREIAECNEEIEKERERKKQWKKNADIFKRLREQL